MYWLQQSEADVPVENDWLGASEADRLNSMRFAKRRADWRLGRWTAKLAVAACLNEFCRPQALAGIEIRPATCGAPEVFIANQPAAVTISLSHCTGVAVCAVARSTVALGCDLEVIEPRSDAFVADYFTPEEQALVAQASATERPRLLTLLWTGKESALKALRAGLRLDTRCVRVSPWDSLPGEGESGDECLEDSAFTFPLSYGLNTWCPLQVRYTAGQIFSGWWQQTGSLLRTIVAAPPPAPPILLTLTGI
ncbi:MAG: 4'-phosphopantetheinyl transferase superfamily protein [Acidobacteriia bacterium]|nr:4'-phosphopantetheinyl transferase superfamily protein [Terriglobia bacterium]